MGTFSSVERVRKRKEDATAGFGRFDAAYCLAEYGSLWELMSVTKVDGKFRKTSTLTLFYEGGGLKCCLSDPDTAQKAFYSFSDGEAVLERLSRAIEEDKLEWRDDKPKR